MNFCNSRQAPDFSASEVLHLQKRSGLESSLRETRRLSLDQRRFQDSSSCAFEELWVIIGAGWNKHAQYIHIVVLVQSLGHIRLSVTPWTTVHRGPLSSTTSQSLLKFMSIELVMLSNHLILYHPLSLLHSVFSIISVFSNGLTFRLR